MNKQNRVRKQSVEKKKWPVPKKQILYGIEGIVIVAVLAIVATLALAQSSSLSLGPNENLVTLCNGRGFQIQRISRTHVRLTCQGDGQQSTPNPQPTATAVLPTSLPDPQPTETPPATPSPTAIPTSAPPPGGDPPTEIGKWQRFEVAFDNSSWNGNPFDLEFTGVFTHRTTGRTVTQFGFYAGNNTWKIFFMPDELGEWTYLTQSSDPDLNGRTGAFNTVPSNLPGQLMSDGNRWRYSDSGDYVSPVVLPTLKWFMRTNTSDGVDDFITWADDTAGAQIIGITLAYCKNSQDEVPYLKGQSGEWFNVEFWDRLNSHFDMMRDRGMGFYLMFYADDADSPLRCGIPAQSAEELRLFRYAVARFSAYPVVMWDSGIDITEYRTLNWIDWYVNWFNTNDPWHHAISSRTGGGSRGTFPTNASYYSDGQKLLPTWQDMAARVGGRNVPTCFTDKWREDYGRGNFNRDKIRKAAWQVFLSYGACVSFGGAEGVGDLEENYAADFEAAPDLGHLRSFYEQVQNYGALLPQSSLIVGGNSAMLAANPGQEYVVYSVNDGTVTIDLHHINGNAVARIYNPVTGQWVSEQTIVGGGNVSFNRPNGLNDWVIHIIQ